MSRLQLARLWSLAHRVLGDEVCEYVKAECDRRQMLGELDSCGCADVLKALLSDDDSATDRASETLVSWARREAIMRSLAADPAPIHAQYAGNGLIALRGLGELVYPLQQR